MTKTVRRGTPEDWEGYLAEREIQVLPLVDDPARSWTPGWCTYPEDFGSLPEVE